MHPYLFSKLPSSHMLQTIKCNIRNAMSKTKQCQSFLPHKQAEYSQIHLLVRYLIQHTVHGINPGKNKCVFKTFHNNLGMLSKTQFVHFTRLFRYIFWRFIYFQNLVHYFYYYLIIIIIRSIIALCIDALMWMPSMFIH